MSSPIPNERVDSIMPLKIPDDTWHLARYGTHRGLSMKQPIGRPWTASYRGMFYGGYIMTLP